MPRRIVRKIIQFTTVTVFIFVFILVLRDHRLSTRSIHNNWPFHEPDRVIIDITIAECFKANPFSSCYRPGNEWDRIDKDLYLGKQWFSAAYLLIRHKHRDDLVEHDNIVTGLSVNNPNECSQTDSGEQCEARPAGLRIRRKPAYNPGRLDHVIGVDVVYGEDAVEARHGWSMIGQPLLLKTGDAVLGAHITIKHRSAQQQLNKPQPRISDGGKFKIMQIADLHLGTGTGSCRDAVPEGYHGGSCKADPRTLEFVSRVLDDEKPDLVVLSGDQIGGDPVLDAPTAIYKYTSLLITRQIPYAVIFGNHDDESTMNREEQMALLQSLPHSLSMAGPDTIDGVGNYYIDVLSQGTSKLSSLTIYLLDTHSRSPDEPHFPGYNWIQPNQIDWFKQTSGKLKRRRQRSKNHMSLAFIHIPLPEYRDSSLPRLGVWREGVTAPRFNSGFRDALVEEGVSVVSAGHDHCNDYCALSSGSAGELGGLWMCYGGGAGFGGYAGYNGYVRRVRMFEAEISKGRIKTWKRVEHRDTESRIDEQILVEGGKPIFHQV